MEIGKFGFGLIHKHIFVEIVSCIIVYMGVVSCIIVYMGVGIQGVRLGRVFVMDDVSNRVYSGPQLSTYSILLTLSFSLPTRRLVATSVTLHPLVQIL